MRFDAKWNDMERNGSQLSSSVSCTCLNQCITQLSHISLWTVSCVKQFIEVTSMSSDIGLILSLGFWDGSHDESRSFCTA